jgi:hypothetical protein
MNPRLERLYQQVASMPIDEDYRTALLHSIHIYGDQIVARAEHDVAGWDDLEALQQVTLGDILEARLKTNLRAN